MTGVERWLSPPPAAVGEDEVVRWLTTAVLEIGEVMVQRVPVPRLEPIRRRVRAALKGHLSRDLVVGAAGIEPTTCSL
ncbi:MAG: hypothetical protein ACRDXC_10880 [Acidimicrobiales bacterium]